MAYALNFSDILPYAGVLGRGAILSLELIAIAAPIGVLAGIAGARIRSNGPSWLSPIVGGYVEIIRNTPFIVQLFFIFFGLPALGLRLGELEAAILAMAVNLGAYSTEIVRAGIASISRGQQQAGMALGLSSNQIFRHVVLVPALRTVWPALSSQIVVVMLGSAVCSQIAVEELSFAANFIQSRNFRAFEVYIVSTLMYLVLAILIRQFLRGFGSALLGQRQA